MKINNRKCVLTIFFDIRGYVCFTYMAIVMSRRSVNLTTPFLVRLRPPNRLTSTKYSGFRQ